MGLLYRLDALDSANLWANTGKTVPATNGSAVAVWSPSTGSTITDDCTQATATNQPTLSTNYLGSGKTAVVFDGLNDRLLTPSSAAWNPSNITVICAARCSSISGDRLFCSKWNESNWNDGWGMGFSGGRFIGMVNAYSGGPFQMTGSQLAVVRTDGSYRDTFYNGRWHGTSVSPTHIASPFAFTLGAGQGGSYPLAVGIHCVRVYDTALSNAELDDVLYACDSTYGLGFYNSRSSGGGSSAPSMRGGFAN